MRGIVTFPLSQRERGQGVRGCEARPARDLATRAACECWKRREAAEIRRPLNPNPFSVAPPLAEREEKGL
jgi:hypothetical protein